MYLLEQMIGAGLHEACWIALGAYALGCFSTGYYLVRYSKGQDLRTLGSGTLGARNAGRILGWRGFVLTVAGDFGKGALAVWAARNFTAEPWMWFVALLGVVVGHIWPVQLKFSGGKGVAASLGGLIVYDFRLAFAYCLIFAVGCLIRKKTTLPGIAAFAVLPWASFFFEIRSGVTGFSEVVGLFVLAFIILLAHRQNLSQEFSLLLQKRAVRAQAHHHKYE